MIKLVTNIRESACYIIAMKYFTYIMSFNAHNNTAR